MRYFIRAVKYFLQLMLILALIVAVLMLTGMVDSDISKVFVNGWDSLWQIALMMAAFAAIYPRFGYVRRSVMRQGAGESAAWTSPEEQYDALKRAMEATGYVQERRTDELVCYRKRSAGDRITRLWEDRITVSFVPGGLELEGFGRDVIRICNALR